MWNRKAAVSGVAFATVAFASACSDIAPTETAALLPETPSLFGGPVPNPSAHAQNTKDAEWVRIAQEVPGFAGYYRGEDGALNVRMAPSAQQLSAAQARQALGSRLSALGVNLAAQPVNLVPAQYDFAALDAMRRAAAPVLAISGVVFTDADEVANRVRIGVENDAARAAVTSALQQAGVPLDAVILSDAEPILQMQTLQDRVRPVAGGLQIMGGPDAGGFYWYCTLGFNVRSPEAPNVRGFVTNSHCTNVMYGLPVGTAFHQNNAPPFGGVDAFIGTEVHDLPTFTGGSCPAGRVCRWSDAAGAQYTSGVDVAFARIYRPSQGLTIDPNNPMYNITAERPFPSVGDQMTKVGRTTGRTQGPVVGSCVDTNVGGVGIPLTLLCQEHVQAGVQGGDSGSPVFDFVPGSTDNVRLTGILWGGGGGNFVFSAMNEVRFENTPPPGLTWVTH